jgi:peptidoglycan/xylan/chitin deacetylase (PgdA/CDA1 family)/uncharacterized caspase-like protein
MATGLGLVRQSLALRVAAGALVVALAAGAGVWWARHSSSGDGGGTSPVPLPAAALAAPAGPALVLADWQAVLAAHRKIIVLLAQEGALSPTEREAVNRAGHAIFHENRDRMARIEQSLPDSATPLSPERLAQVQQVLDYVESGEGLFDADRLAFNELLGSLKASLSKDSSLPAIKLIKRINEDLDALAEIERTYDKEMRAIFNRFEATRSIELKRERWDDYVAHLQTLYRRDDILKDFGVVVPFPEQAPARGKDDPNAEVSGSHFPAKTVMLTFDDGPHPVFSAEIAAILKQYNAPAVFFQVGRNLGSRAADGKVSLNKGAAVAKKLREDGHALANHSYSHAQLSKTTGDTLKSEILDTDALLTAVDATRAPLFRFPYGAKSAEGAGLLSAAHLRSVMWNIDSLDWADPVPSSIADRVVQAVEKEGRGIILFHDIHERTVKALPLVLDRLSAAGYQFAGWDGKTFSVAKGSTPAKPVTDAARPDVANGNSWAVVIGVDTYAKWPRLQYATRDATAVAQLLTEKFGFSKDRIITLTNQQATRAAILAAFNGGLAQAGVKKNDQILVFFAGHGATRKLSSGRDLGYIVPVDSDPEQIAVDGIAMTEIQNIAESLTAKHVLFVMDACYSGLGLTRGGGNFQRDNAKRIGRQMLTAGGADQLVSDGGPNGHSVFTWALLQGLGGKADLNGDGIITGTELAAYVAPAVSNVAPQTPAFGSLPGSEGGDFVFELPAEGEYLSAQTGQLSSDVIAINAKLDQGTVNQTLTAAAVPQPAAPRPVIIKDLQGGEQKIAAPAAGTLSSRQLAQHANDAGLQHYREKRYAQAEEQFTLALKYRPDFALAANNLGFVFFRQDKFAEAARWFEATLKIDPARAVAYLNLGDAYARTGDVDKARKAYQTYLDLSPTASAAAAVRAQLEKLPR